MTNRYAIDKSIVVNDLRLHYRDWGGRGWPILLLHGLSSTGHIWDLVAPLLVEEGRVIALDLRGHGLSDKPEGEYSFEQVGGDVLGVIRALGFTRPLLVGHDWGANVALWLGAHHGDEIGGVIMIDGGIVDLGILSWEDTLEQHRPPRINGMPVEAFKEQVLGTMPQGIITPAVEAAIMASMEIDAENGVHPRLPRTVHLRILRAMWEQHLGDLYEKIICPVLIIPTRSRGSDPPTQIARKELCVSQAEDAIADVEVVWLDDSIHDAPLQHPHRLAEEIRRFIRERL
ncbi:MAG: hypothetical protein Kow00124_31680 [Anaerolineae bacterium]